jgi:hypothetical protein
MSALLSLFLNVLFFKKGPKDVPHSSWLLGVLIGVDLILSTLVGAMDLILASAVIQSTLSLGLMALFLTLTLKFAGKSERFVKTFTTTTGVDVLMTLLGLTALLLGEVAGGLLGWGLLLLMVWQMAVLAHILREALSTRLLPAVGLALSYTILAYRVMMIVLPLPAA